MWSDLHLEFQDRMPELENPGADVLILSGDVCVAEHLYRNPTAGLNDMLQNGFYATDAIRYRKFFHRVSQQFDTVVYVMGNHEHYKGRWDRTEEILREEVARYPNIHLLEQNKLVLDDVVFLGATFWTDLNKSDPLSVMRVKDVMNDYKVITEHEHGNYHKLRPLTTMYKHVETVHWLKTELSADNRKTVVVGHHAPSWKSIHPKYANQQMTNSAYASNLEDVMLDNPHVALWTAGHVHNCHWYYVGETLVAVNPHGYPNEGSGFNPNRVIDLDSMPSKHDVLNNKEWVI